MYRSRPPLSVRTWTTMRLESMSSGRRRQASGMRSPPADCAITIARYVLRHYDRPVPRAAEGIEHALVHDVGPERTS